jgi:glycosyltransferase involved in cell wall biosynthesis
VGDNDNQNMAATDSTTTPGKPPREYPIKLSVQMVTYNQERYVEQAIRSALMQRTDFDFEIVIGEDCSKDRTREICRRLAAEHPDKIRLLEREKNLGMHENHRQTFFACRGQYIAFLEGDDFWTVPEKLQRQVEFLDAHPECVLCYHNVLIFDEHTNEEAFYCRPNHPTITGLKEQLQEISVNTASVVMRNGLFEQFPEFGKDLIMGDWIFYIWIASMGKLGYLPDVMACYRQHDKGTWMQASVGDRIGNVFKMYDHVDEHFQGQYHDIIQVLKMRYRNFFEMDGSRRKWKARAEKAEKRIEELERSRRRLKLKQRRLEEQVRELEAGKSADAIA